MRGKLKSKFVSRKIEDLITLYVPAFIIAFVIIGPIAYMFFTSVISDVDAIEFGKTLQIPSTITFEPYIRVFKIVRLAKALYDTSVYSLLSAISVTLVALIAGYAFSFFRFRGRRISLKFFIFIQLIPGYALLIPMFMYARTLGIYDTYWALLFTFGGFTVSFALWMAFTFFGLTPHELHDSAMIDGCSELQTFVRIFLPLISPGIVAVFVYVFITSWIQFMWPLILTNVNVRAVPVEMTLLWSQTQYLISFNYIMAGGIITLVPPVAVALVFQKWLIKGLTAGAVKG